MSPQQALYLVWLVWGASWLAASLWSSRVVVKVPARREIPYRVLLLLGFALLFGLYPHHLAPLPRPWAPPALGWMLVAVAGAGAALCWWARLHLGKLWSANITRKQDHRVVDSGPYALVRHPIYAGVTIMSLAVVLMRGNPIAGIGFVVTVLAWALKAGMEERFLRAELGAAAYDAYVARVPMLVPFLKF